MTDILNVTNSLPLNTTSDNETPSGESVYNITNRTEPITTMAESETWRLTNELHDFNNSAIGRKLMNLVNEYMAELKETKMHGQLDKGSMTWTYWGALFFCGTVFTTVGHLNLLSIRYCKLFKQFNINKEK